MKVSELLAALAAVNPEAEVVLSRDPEGNGFGTLSGYEPAHVRVGPRGRVEVLGHATVGPARAPAIVLWPAA